MDIVLCRWRAVGIALVGGVLSLRAQKERACTACAGGRGRGRGAAGGAGLTDATVLIREVLPELGVLVEEELRVVVALPRLLEHESYLHARERLQLVGVSAWPWGKVRSTAHNALLHEPATRVGLKVGARQALIAFG